MSSPIPALGHSHFALEGRNKKADKELTGVLELGRFSARDVTSASCCVALTTLLSSASVVVVFVRGSPNFVKWVFFGQCFQPSVYWSLALVFRNRKPGSVVIYKRSTNHCVGVISKRSTNHCVCVWGDLLKKNYIEIYKGSRNHCDVIYKRNKNNCWVTF